MDAAETQIRNQRERQARAAMQAAAVDRTPISYSNFLDEINWDVAPNSPQLRDLLCEISADSLRREGILLSAVVVNADGERKDIPGSGFFEFAAKEGFKFSDERDFWAVEVEKVYSANSVA